MTMRKNALATLCLALCLALGLAACAQHEVPFAVNTGPVEAPADLLALGTAGRVVVEVPMGLAPAGLAQQVVLALSQQSVPASLARDPGGVAVPVPNGYRVSLSADAGNVLWTVRGPDGLTVTRNTLAVEPEKTLAVRLATRLAQVIESDMERPLSERMASQVNGLSREERRAIAGDKARTAAVKIAAIHGLDGPKAALLEAAITAQLARLGHALNPNSPYGIGAEVILGPADGAGMRLLTVQWTVSDPTHTLGTVAQSNPVAPAMLDGGFASLAVAIAQGAADGIDTALVQGVARGVVGDP